jgi:hypothetical protein
MPGFLRRQKQASPGTTACATGLSGTLVEWALKELAVGA